MIAGDAGGSGPAETPGKVWGLIEHQMWGQAFRTWWLDSHLIFVLAA